MSDVQLHNPEVDAANADRLVVRTDVQPALSAVTELQALQRETGAYEFVQSVLDSAQTAGELLRFQGEPVAPGTREMWIRLQPGDLLLYLLTALRARKKEVADDGLAA